jgi:hypothetical protein
VLAAKQCALDIDELVSASIGHNDIDDNDADNGDGKCYDDDDAMQMVLAMTSLMVDDGSDGELTGCVGQFILLPLNSVLQVLGFASRLLNARLHRLGRHITGPRIHG